MKPFDELTDAELLELTADQIERYVDLACAEAGVALPPVLPAPPDTSGPKPDMTVYAVGGFEFSDKADALRVADAVNAARSYGDARCIGHNYNAPYKWVPRETPDQQVSERACFKLETAAGLTAELNRRAQEKADYDKARQEYDSIEYKRGELRREIASKVQTVQATERRRARLRADYKRYLELADGRRRIAARFLKSAQEDADTLCPELFVFTQADPPDPKPRAYHGDEPDLSVTITNIGTTPIGVTEQADGALVITRSDDIQF
jgi:hypothetical protein